MTKDICQQCEHPAHPGGDCSAPSIASAGGCDCGPCHGYLDLDWLLYGDEEVDPEERFADLPLIECALMEGHAGPHRVDAAALREAVS